MSTEHLLEINNLSVVYKTDLETVHAVNGCSFFLNEGETLGLVGETGAGKTTTALTIMGLLPERTGRVLEGEIIFNGENLLKKSEIEMRNYRGEKMAMIFQDPMTALNPILTVGEQIGEAIALHNAEWTKEQIENRVDEVLSLVGILPARKNDYPHQFSGGMKQRVVIAMALSCEPKLLLADEPTTALDVTIQAQVLKLMRELKVRLNTSMVLITHDLGIVAQTCDYVAVMYAGEIIEMGRLEDIFCGDKHHPYTTGLFGSIPNIKTKTARLSPIPGQMPDPTNLPKGCKFSLRCPKCCERCQTEEPGYFEEGTHKIKCFLFDD